MATARQTRQPARRVVHAVGAGLIMLAGLAIVVLGVTQWAAGSEFAANAETAEGVIVQVKRVTVADRHASGVNYHPRVAFITSGGRCVVFDDTGGSNEKDLFQVGAPVTVYYDPHHPRGARLSRHADRNTGMVLTGGGVAFCVMVATAVCLQRRRDPAGSSDLPLPSLM